MTRPNVRRISGSANPDHPSHTGLGHVDIDGVYRFPGGTTLPATGGVTLPDGTHRDGNTAMVVREDRAVATLPPLDAADPTGSALQRLHCVDRALQDAYDLDAFGSIGGDPVAPDLPADAFGVPSDTAKEN